MKNVGGRMGGAITAALFLKQFVDTEKVTTFAHWMGLLPMHCSEPPELLALVCFAACSSHQL